tara:strand:+ start:115 stop:351 length:237 start_codon:yes stop_codon:yes gene_type:complete
MNSKVKVGDWISVGESMIPAYVFRVISDIEVYAGYYQNDLKAIGEDFTFDGCFWRFKNSGPSGTYLRGAEAAVVKRGP